MRQIAFIHTAHPAIPPLMQFYTENAPDLRITNLMEDGLLRFLAEAQFAQAEARLRALTAAARDAYGAELAMITCSSVPLSMARTLAAEFGFPVIKIDGPMAAQAVQAGSKIGVAVTFEGTVEPTSRLIRDTASEAGRHVEIDLEIAPGAYKALLAGDVQTHDAALLATIANIAARGADSVVLAQVSMARVQQRAQSLVGVPVLSSFDTSLAAVRAALDR